MALTITTNEEGVLGDLRYKVVTLAFDSSYPTGGESFTAANLGWDSMVLVTAANTSGLAFDYDYTNALLLAYEQGITTGSTAAADSTSGALAEDIAAAETVVRFMDSAVDTTYGFGGLVQVANTTDLSTAAASVRVFALGH